MPAPTSQTDETAIAVSAVGPDTRGDRAATGIEGLDDYYKYAGEVRQALSVFKRRGGPHERSIRRLTLSSGNGIEVGEPLSEFHGVLTGVPIYEGNGAGGAAPA